VRDLSSTGYGEYIMKQQDEFGKLAITRLVNGLFSRRHFSICDIKVVEALRGDAILNPARLLSQLTDEGRDFAFIEDRYIGSNIKMVK